MTEANTVFGEEKDGMARLPGDLSFETDAEDPAAGDRERATDTEPDTWEIRGGLHCSHSPQPAHSLVHTNILYRPSTGYP